MKGLEVVRHNLRGLDEQIVEVMLITYDVWFCSLPAPVTALTFANLPQLRERRNIFIVLTKEEINTFKTKKFLPN